MEGSRGLKGESSEQKECSLLSSTLKNPNPPGVVPSRVLWGSYGIVTLLAFIAEVMRWINPQTRTESLAGWLAGRDADWLPFLPLLLLAPLFARIVSFRKGNPKPTAWQTWCRKSASNSPVSRSEWGGAVLVFFVAFLVSRGTGQQYAGFPPAYHDEYSYLFQAQTYLQGRWAFPSHPEHPEWFDQMHVLNDDGAFASRYFPGTGAWMAPFVWLGDPWLGHQLAQGLAAMLIFWIGRELSNNGVGLLAGVLFGLSPGLILFSNLLLAHHPTLVGLLLFCWAFLRWMRCGRNGLLCVAGTGLAFAMLCRPMTAAGFALPFGILFARWWLTGTPQLRFENEKTSRKPLKARTGNALSLAVPLLLGFVLLGVSNQAITGDWETTPYSLYTRIYTPRHQYGFNNAVEGEKQLGPKVLDNYDRWAENLTPSLAARNVGARLEASLRWTLGIVPLLLGGIICLFTPRLGDRRWTLIWFSILSLHLVHIPYWFAGIMNWHYVFETAPLWILLFAEANRRVGETWHQEQRTGLLWWRRLLIAITLAVNLVTVVPFWPGRIELGMAELGFARNRYHAFRQQIDEIRHGRDALVLVIPDDADRHMDYVTNRPDLGGPVLIARIRDRNDLQKAASAYPDRLPLVFDASSRQFSLLNK